jgi:SAM-dependent methyltransferase
MQITTGIRSILSHPAVYSAFQYLMGAKKGWSLFVDHDVRPENGDVILDIGCGPADILEYLPKVDYWGFDISEKYIDKAKAKYGQYGKFYSKMLTIADIEQMPKFDLVMACGVLHHIDDRAAIDLLKLACAALKPGGRMVTIDPCFIPNQNPIARFLISKDRGQNVRDQAGYMRLAHDVFSKVDMSVKHKTWIPYTHCCMECTRT